MSLTFIPVELDLRAVRYDGANGADIIAYLSGNPDASTTLISDDGQTLKFSTVAWGATTCKRNQWLILANNPGNTPYQYWPDTYDDLSGWAQIATNPPAAGS